MDTPPDLNTGEDTGSRAGNFGAAAMLEHFANAKSILLGPLLGKGSVP